MCCTNETPTYWVREGWTGRYFRSNLALLEKAVAEANSFLHKEGDIDLNTFYDILGLESVTSGDDQGWSGDEIQVIYGTAIGGPLAPPTAQEAPIITLAYRNEPQPHMAGKY